MKNLKSRKFLLSLGAFTSSVTTLAIGLKSKDHFMTAVGTIGAVLSAGIYSYSESSVDLNAVACQRGETQTYAIGFQMNNDREEVEDE